MHGESDETTTIINLTSYFPKIPTFTLQLDRKYRLYQKVNECRTVFYSEILNYTYMLSLKRMCRN
jgi:hypothetical protein